MVRLELRSLSTIESEEIIVALEGDGGPLGEEEDIPRFSEDLGALLVGDAAAALEHDLDLVVGICVYEGCSLLHAEKAACYGGFICRSDDVYFLSIAFVST